MACGQQSTLVENDKMSTETATTDDTSKILDDIKAENEALKVELEKVKAKANELLDETKAAKKAKKDAEDHAASIAAEEAKKKGDFENLYKSAQAEIEKEKAASQEFKNKWASEQVRNTAMKLAAEIADGSNAEILSDYVARRLKMTDDGLKVTDESGNVTVSPITDLQKEFAGNVRYNSLLRGNKSNGSGATGATNGVSGAGKYTQEQWDSLDTAKKMSVAKELSAAGKQLSDIIV